VYYQTAEFCCAFSVGIKTQCNDIHTEIFPVYGGKCLSCKVVHNWVKIFPQGYSKVADDAQPGHTVEIATEAIVQWVEDLI
jgi:hypothetical protein